MKKLLMLLCSALCSPALASAQAIYTKNAPAPIGPYSQAVQVDNVVYFSGQIPIDPKTGELVSEDFDKQARQVLINLSEVAKAAGGTLNDIVKITVYVTDLSNFAILNKMMEEYFHKPYPARVTIEVKGLPKKALVEIEAIMKVKKKG
jgi:2-iminobutanoate/2-iminopropanoate deaminase